MHSIPVVIVGAGPSGLAVAACLEKQGIAYRLLEKSEAVGGSWQRHYKSLTLHTLRRHSALPYLPFKGTVSTYPTRDELVSYLKDYTKKLAVQPEFGHALLSAHFEAPHWRVETNQSNINSHVLVMATGHNRLPRQPSWPNRSTYKGQVIHSVAYQDASPYQGMQVLVVGLGNTGGDIASELCQSGVDTTVSVRGPVHVVPSTTLGISAQMGALMMQPLPMWMQDTIVSITSKLTYGDLTSMGIQSPSVGPVKQINDLEKIPLMDAGTVDFMRRGKIKVMPAIQHFTEGGVRFVDGNHQAFDVVILATGYDSQLTDFLPGLDHAFNERGNPIKRGKDAALPGLHFVGFSNPITGTLRQIGIEAKGAAKSIQRYLKDKA